MTVLPKAVVVAIAKAVEQIVLLTVWIDIPGGIVETVANCSPSRAVIPFMTALFVATCTALPLVPSIVVDSLVEVILRYIDIVAFPSEAEPILAVVRREITRSVVDAVSLKA